MVRNARPIATAIALLLALSGLGPSTRPASAQSSDPDLEEYFDRTGHFVRGPFLQEFRSMGGLAVFGYPITDEFYERRLGRLVQYFQRARLEWWPENQEPYRVQLGLLGDELGLGESRLPPGTTIGPSCRYFPETGHSVCLAFLEYFLKHGNIDVFGYPISEYQLDHGRIVQNFQRARMEWHPERPRGSRVELAWLGALHFEAAGYGSHLLAPLQSFGLGENTAITVKPSFSRPVARRAENQTIFLVVRNQLGHPVAGAEATITVYFPTGIQTFFLPATDSRGITQIPFPVGDAAQGELVEVDVSATSGGLRATTRDSFLVWW